MVVKKLEQFLLHLWTEAFGKEGISVDDDFFDLGGHSLMAAQLLTKIRETTKSSLTLMTFFDFPTIKELAEEISQLELDENSLDQFLQQALPVETN